jgi:hypothetical protein
VSRAGEHDRVLGVPLKSDPSRLLIVGVMTISPHPTSQLSLPGQSHTAEGPHDHTGMYGMHFGFRRT